MNPIYASRRRFDMIIRTLCVGAALFGVTWLALILLGVVLTMIRLQQEETQREIDSLRRYAHAM